MAGERKGVETYSPAGTLILVGLLRASLFLVVTEAKNFLVGEDYHWQSPPPNDSKFYQEWADKISPVTVGDSITFVLDSRYSVFLVNETDFRECNSSHSMELAHGGPTSLPFDSAGVAYIIDGLYCSDGMLFKLLVNPLPVYPEPPPTPDTWRGPPVHNSKAFINPADYVSTSVIAAIAAAAGITVLCILAGFIWCAFYRSQGDSGEASHSSQCHAGLAASQHVLKSPPMFCATATDHAIVLSASEHDRRFIGIEVQNPLYVPTGEPRAFSFQELNDATRGFARDFLLGEGGSGEVYRGKVYMEEWQTIREVAIKKPTCKTISREDLHQLTLGLSVLANASHRNLVQLLGYSSEYEGTTPILVYELVSRGSLSNHLFDYRLGSSSHNGIESCDSLQQFLDWSTRLQIAIDTAKGLDYLHTSAHPAPIIHGAVNADNILLDEACHAKVANFGLWGLLPSQESMTRGTVGYAEPYLEGRATEKSDVYSFGVVLLTLLTSQRPCQQPWCASNGNFVDPFLTFLRTSTLELILDPDIQRSESMESMEEMKTVAKIAAACMLRRKENRPSMRDVLFLLENVQVDRSQRKGEFVSRFHNPDERINSAGLSRTAAYFATWTDYSGSFIIDSHSDRV